MLDDGAPGGQTADVTEIGEEIGHLPILMRAADSAAVAVPDARTVGWGNYTADMADSRKIAATALLGSGAAAMSAVALSVLGLLVEVKVARHAIGTSDARPPLPDTIFGDDDVAGEPISCLILGDSAAVGYGMTTLDATPPAMVGIGLAHLLDHPVRVTSVAVVGAQTSDLDKQITLGLDAKPQIALIVVGTNDVTHRVSPSHSARILGAAVRRLKAEGCEVVVGTCPDLGTVQPLPQPLRKVARAWSRKLAAKQAVATLDAGGRAVSLGGLLGPVFASRADVMFGQDHFHPSETGYAHMVSVVIPTLAAALRDKNIDATYAAEVPAAEPPRDLLPLHQAATKAAQHAGTELVRTGRWATLRRRRRSYAAATD